MLHLVWHHCAKSFTLSLQHWGIMGNIDEPLSTPQRLKTSTDPHSQYGCEDHCLVAWDVQHVPILTFTFRKIERERWFYEIEPWLVKEFIQWILEIAFGSRDIWEWHILLESPGLVMLVRRVSWLSETLESFFPSPYVEKERVREQGMKECYVWYARLTLAFCPVS